MNAQAVDQTTVAIGFGQSGNGNFVFAINYGIIKLQLEFPVKQAVALMEQGLAKAKSMDSGIVVVPGGKVEIRNRGEQ